MDNRGAELLEQFQKEVPGGRRAWPESIKRLVFELKDRGVSVEIRITFGLSPSTPPSAAELQNHETHRKHNAKNASIFFSFNIIF